MLLVDSEAAVAEHHQAGRSEAWLPWAHLKIRDDWSQPPQSAASDCHLMVQVMENWFLADRRTLQEFFGQGFNVQALPAEAHAVENVSKAQAYSALQTATRQCKTKTAYGKGEHSFKLLARLDPEGVAGASPWARRFIQMLKEKMDT